MTCFENWWETYEFGKRFKKLENPNQNKVKKFYHKRIPIQKTPILKVQYKKPQIQIKTRSSKKHFQQKFSKNHQTKKLTFAQEGSLSTKKSRNSAEMNPKQEGDCKKRDKQKNTCDEGVSTHTHFRNTDYF